MTISKVINSIGVVLLFIVLTRAFTVQEIGVFVFFYVLVMFLTNIVEGIGLAVRKRVSATDENQAIYLTVALILSTIFQLVVASTLYLSYAYIPTAVLPETIQLATNELVLASIALLFSMSFGKLLLNYNSGLGYPSRSEWFGRALPGVVFFGLTMVVVYIGLGLPYIFLCGSIGYTISIGLMFMATRPDVLQIPSKKYFVSIFKFSKWSIPERVSSNIYNSADVILLGLVVSSTAVGFYETSNNLAALVYAVPYGFFSVISVKISGLYSQGKVHRTYPILKKSIIGSSIFPVFFLFLVIIYGETIISLTYGSAYSGAVYYLIGLSSVQLLTSYRRPIEAFNHGTDNPQIPFYANIFAIAVNFITVLPLIILFGGLGVVISTVISAIFRLGIILWHTQEHVLRLGLNKEFVYPYIASILLILGSYGILQLFSLGLFGEVLLIIFICLIYGLGMSAKIAD